MHLMRQLNLQDCLGLRPIDRLCHAFIQPQVIRNSRGQYVKGNESGKRFQKGEPGYWIGKTRSPFSDQWKANISEGLKKVENKARFVKNDPRITGENNPNWAGGITKLYVKIRNLWQYNDWQSQCRLRDNYTCQNCKKYLKRLNERCTVDHYIKSFAQIIYDNKVMSIEEALNCEELWDINNGRTLCDPCHRKTDNYRKRITREEIS